MNAHAAITIFGGTGDLTFRKLLPALYNLSAAQKLPEDFRIVAVGRRAYTAEEYAARARDWVQKFSRLPFTAEDFARFAAHLVYFRMDFTAAEAYGALDAYYEETGIDSHVFYLAVAPEFFATIAQGLARVRGLRGASSGKVIVEKPFGENLTAASALNDKLETFFSLENTYHIDHYLGKEMIRNIQTIRFANPIFADVWDARHIESIQISALETVGVETRGGYYDASGALKDMVQNHLFQILSIVAMERPVDFTPESMHAEQLRVLRALRPVAADGVADALVLAQYDGYRSEPQVAPDSRTETYAALRLFIDNARWQDMPFYIRTGKKLDRREMEVAVSFRRMHPSLPQNVLVVKIQPDEGVYLQFNIKKPGETDEVAQATMDFCQSCSLANRINTPEAYERLLTACLAGERSWFSQWDQIETSWRFIDGLRTTYREQLLPIYTYSPKTCGPQEAEQLLARAGHRWFACAEEA